MVRSRPLIRYILKVWYSIMKDISSAIKKTSISPFKIQFKTFIHCSKFESISFTLSTPPFLFHVRNSFPLHLFSTVSRSEFNSIPPVSHLLSHFPKRWMQQLCSTTNILHEFELQLYPLTPVKDGTLHRSCAPSACSIGKRWYMAMLKPFVLEHRVVGLAYIWATHNSHILIHKLHIRVLDPTLCSSICNFNTSMYHHVANQAFAKERCIVPSELLWKGEDGFQTHIGFWQRTKHLMVLESIKEGQKGV